LGAFVSNKKPVSCQSVFELEFGFFVCSF